MLSSPFRPCMCSSPASMLPTDLNHVGEEVQHGRKTYTFKPFYALVGVLNLQVYSTTELIMLEKNSNMGGICQLSSFV